MRRRFQLGSTVAKVMFIISWLLFLGIVTYFAGVWVQSQNNPNQTVQSKTDAAGNREVVLLANRGHQYIFNGKINGQPVKFLLDTGASNLSIPGKLARKLQLREGRPLKAVTAGGVVTIYATRIREVRFGNIRLRNIRGSINPHMHSDYVLLGMSVLRHLEFRKENGKFILIQKSNE
jgi:aspartyl protease family protein